MDDKKEKMEEGKNYVEKLFPRIKDIKDEGLRNKVVNVWLRAWKMSDYKKIEDHSAYEPEEAKIQLSNVDHTNQVVEGVIAVANVVDRTQQIKINIDYLIAGAILHDIDKILLYHKEKDPVTPYGRLTQVLQYS
jgi:23S rRNA maturation-related 3'-5' exoribonuclease YhaM